MTFRGHPRSPFDRVKSNQVNRRYVRRLWTDLLRGASTSRHNQKARYQTSRHWRSDLWDRSLARAATVFTGEHTSWKYAGHCPLTQSNAISHKYLALLDVSRTVDVTSTSAHWMWTLVAGRDSRTELSTGERVITTTNALPQWKLNRRKLQTCRPSCERTTTPAHCWWQRALLQPCRRIEAERAQDWWK